MLATVAAAAIPATAALAAVDGRNDDPIFAAIERHKAAQAVEEAEVHLESDLDEQLPYARRQTTLWDGELEIAEGDDPRWIEHLRDYHAAFEAQESAAIALVNIQPTTLAGVAALLAYAADYVAAGNRWPDAMFDDEDEKEAKAYGLDWSVFLHRSLADAIRNIAERVTA
jgi:hypothetical protein